MRTTVSACREELVGNGGSELPSTQVLVRWLVRVLKRRLKAFVRGHGLSRAGASQFNLLFCFLGYS